VLSCPRQDIPKLSCRLLSVGRWRGCGTTSPPFV
jgi:hypothetical protein